jgi:hypothetical protein
MKSQRVGFKSDVPNFDDRDGDIGTVQDMRKRESVYFARET